MIAPRIPDIILDQYRGVPPVYSGLLSVSTTDLLSLCMVCFENTVSSGCCRIACEWIICSIQFRIAASSALCVVVLMTCCVCCVGACEGIVLSVYKLWCSTMVVLHWGIAIGGECAALSIIGRYFVIVRCGTKIGLICRFGWGNQ